LAPRYEREAGERRVELGRVAAIKQHHGESGVSQKIDQPTNEGKATAQAAKIMGTNRQ